MHWDGGWQCYAVVLESIPPAISSRTLPSRLARVVTIIGLCAKNAILIVEVAQKLISEGRSTRQAILDAASMRLRPIVMTSLAFMFGVLPLVLASGAGSASQRAIGTAVFGGMLSATLLTLYFVPLLHSLIAPLRKRPKGAISARHRGQAREAPASTHHV